VRGSHTVLALAATVLLSHTVPARCDDEVVRIFIHAAYGTPETVYLRGRALEIEERPPPGKADSAWRNLRRALSEWETDEVSGLEIRVTWQGGRGRTVTDEEGFLDLELSAPPGSAFRPEDPPLLRIVGRTRDDLPDPLPVEVRPAILAPGSLAVVSDLDDTVVETGVTDRTAMVSRALLENAAGLEPVPGVADLYRRIQDSRSPPVPVFYLSGSPVNLHRRLCTFLEIHRFPAGSMLLKNLGRGGADPLLEQEAYKLRNLLILAERLPEVRFLLFGDSGQADAGVFARFLSERPERVAAAFVRRLPDFEPEGPLPEGIHFTRDSLHAQRVLADIGLLEAGRPEEAPTAGNGRTPGGDGRR
jgi:phosphatidate phosphatase APP1